MQPAFMTAINTLSEILEQRDNVYKQYVAEGSQPIIIKTLDRGNQTPAKNPLLMVWQDLNTQALAYMDSLGLTARGLRKIIDKRDIKSDGGAFFEDFISNIEREFDESEGKK